MDEKDQGIVRPQRDNEPLEGVSTVEMPFFFCLDSVCSARPQHEQGEIRIVLHRQSVSTSHLYFLVVCFLHTL